MLKTLGLASTDIAAMVNVWVDRMLLRTLRMCDVGQVGLQNVLPRHSAQHDEGKVRRIGSDVCDTYGMQVAGAAGARRRECIDNSASVSQRQSEAAVMITDSRDVCELQFVKHVCSRALRQGPQGCQG